MICKRNQVYFFIFSVMFLTSWLLGIETDRALFLFDQGEKNMVASMLRYAEEHDKLKLRELDFKIVFMGSSVDAMQQEPFSHYPEKMIHYKDLKIEEGIDHQWKRDRELLADSLIALSEHLKIRKKIWLPVSCAIFKQLAFHYQSSSDIQVVALRDNPGPNGDTDYFKMAQEVQRAADHLVVPSQAVVDEIHETHKSVTIIGHPPLEEWQIQAKSVNKAAIVDQLGLDPKLPIVVYAGVYGDFYPPCFEKFLSLAPKKGVQILILPHPRYKGSVEAKICETLPYAFERLEMVGEFIQDPPRHIKSIEAIAIADVVVVADATSTTVFQANAIGKKVLYIHTGTSEVSETFCRKKLLYKVSSQDEFVKVVEASREASFQDSPDVFTLLGIPRHGAQLLWQTFSN